MNKKRKFWKWLTKHFGTYKPDPKKGIPRFIEQPELNSKSLKLEKKDYVPHDEDVLVRLHAMSFTRGYVEESSGIDRRDWNKVANHIALGMPWKVIDDTIAYTDVPLALYADFSLSDYKVSFVLASLILRLLKNGTMLFIGENGYVERIFLTKNRKLIQTDISPEKAFYLLTRDDPDGLKALSAEESDLASAVKRYHVRKIWVFTDFDASKIIKEISRSVKLTWFCTEYLNYKKSRIEEQWVIIDDLPESRELISLRNDFDGIRDFANDSGKELSDTVRERGFIYE